VSLPITTKRLIICPFTVADFEAIHAVWSDPAVMAPIPSQPYDREKSWSRLREKFRHQARHGFSKWAVAEKASGTVIGECGVHYLEDGPDIELGYKLARAYWGRGLAAEAAQACLDRALAERPERVVAIVDPANIHSARVLGKIGMVQDGTFPRLDHTWDFYVAIRRQSTVDSTEAQPPGRLPGTSAAGSEPASLPCYQPASASRSVSGTGQDKPGAAGILRRLLLVDAAGLRPGLLAAGLGLPRPETRPPKTATGTTGAAGKQPPVQNVPPQRRHCAGSPVMHLRPRTPIDYRCRAERRHCARSRQGRYHEA
jgi:ribosomal-protein-alanine N-acetyltransferase